jgi:hypothetical protein
MVPIYAIALIISHAGKEHTTGLSLLDNVFDYFRTPVIVFPVIEGVFPDVHGISRAEDYATVATNAVRLVASYLIVFSIVIMHIEATLIDTNLALDATARISFYYKFRWQISLHLCPPIIGLSSP